MRSRLRPLVRTEGEGQAYAFIDPPLISAPARITFARAANGRPEMMFNGVALPGVAEPPSYRFALVESP